MTDNSPPGSVGRYDQILPGAIMLPALELWQESLTLGTTWWNGMVSAWWPEHPAHHVPAHHDPHHQLVVPDPIEADGERALVA